MRNAELRGWHWLHRSHSRFDVSITISHSTLRIPHSAFRLMNWFNAVDATYRTDLRELNELNFARFEAKLGERMAQLEAHLTRRMFAFWAPTPLAVIGTGIGVISLLLRR